MPPHIKRLCADNRPRPSAARRHSHPTCSTSSDSKSSDSKRLQAQDPLRLNIKGVNLGGWLVIQPWVAPSLFFQFEGRPPQYTAMDMHSFCAILGPWEGNRQLREHWRKWVTTEDLEELVEQGINTVRVPVGDWMWTPYEPYTG